MPLLFGRILAALLVVGMTAVAHPVGFRTFDLEDESRPGGYWRYVPMQVWYPAQPGTGQPMTVGQYWALRAHPGVVKPLSPSERSRIGTTASGMLRFAGLPAASEAELDAFFATPARARLGATPASGKWPLILGGLEGADGCSSLAEALAEQGYVVVTFQSPPEAGAMQVTRPAQVTSEVERTLGFLLGQMRSLWDIDEDRVSLAAFNFNGMAAIQFAMRYPGVKSILSLDGWESKGNGDAGLRSSIWWAPPRMRASYLVFSQDEPPSHGGPPANRAAFERLRYSDRTWVKIAGMRHLNHVPDFNTLPGVPDSAREGYRAMVDRTLAFFAARSLAADRLSKEFEHRDALPPVPDEIELDRLMMTDVAATLEMYRRAHARDPDLDLLSERAFHLYAFRYQQQGAAEKELLVRQAAADLFPNSPSTALQLALALERLGRIEPARRQLADVDARLERAPRLAPPEAEAIRTAVRQARERLAERRD